MGIPVMNRLIVLRETITTTPFDGSSHAILAWNGWWVVSVALFAGNFLIGRYFNGSYGQQRCLLQKGMNIWKKMTPDKRKRVRRGIGIAAVIVGCTAAICCVCYLAKHPMDDEWGSGRGALWRIAWEGFTQASWQQKWIGVGPDCFAEHLDTVIGIHGHWSEAVYANAHNEWLNQLVNIGILGTGCYFGIFCSAWKRYRRIIPGMFAIILYLLHSAVSFQQVMNAPFLFLLLGLCENQCREMGKPRQSTSVSAK